MEDARYYIPVIHIYIGAYTKIFANEIFEVGSRSSKNANIWRLENLALYGKQEKTFSKKLSCPFSFVKVD